MGIDPFFTIFVVIVLNFAVHEAQADHQIKYETLKVDKVRMIVQMNLTDPGTDNQTVDKKMQALETMLVKLALDTDFDFLFEAQDKEGAWKMPTIPVSGRVDEPDLLAAIRSQISNAHRDSIITRKRYYSIPPSVSNVVSVFVAESGSAVSIDDIKQARDRFGADQPDIVAIFSELSVGSQISAIMDTLLPPSGEKKFIGDFANTISEIGSAVREIGDKLSKMCIVTKASIPCHYVPGKRCVKKIVHEYSSIDNAISKYCMRLDQESPCPTNECDDLCNRRGLVMMCSAKCGGGQQYLSGNASEEVVVLLGSCPSTECNNQQCQSKSLDTGTVIIAVLLICIGLVVLVVTAIGVAFFFRMVKRGMEELAVKSVSIRLSKRR